MLYSKYCSISTAGSWRYVFEKIYPFSHLMFFNSIPPPLVHQINVYYSESSHSKTYLYQVRFNLIAQIGSR